MYFLREYEAFHILEAYKEPFTWEFENSEDTKNSEIQAFMDPNPTLTTYFTENI